MAKPDHYQAAAFFSLGDAYKDDTDFQTDYFDKGRIVLFEDSPYYATARARVEEFRAAR